MRLRGILRLGRVIHLIPPTHLDNTPTLIQLYYSLYNTLSYNSLKEKDLSNSFTQYLMHYISFLGVKSGLSLDLSIGCPRVFGLDLLQGWGIGHNSPLKGVILLTLCLIWGWIWLNLTSRESGYKLGVGGGCYGSNRNRWWAG